MVRMQHTNDDPQRRPMRLVVYSMLAASVGTSFFLGDKLWAAARGGDLPIWAALLPITTFTAFAVVYAWDRWQLVKRHSFPLGRALLQVGLAVAFLTSLWPHQALEYRIAKDAMQPPSSAMTLLSHREKAVRAAACELLGYQGEIAAIPRIERMTRLDPADNVRSTCHNALVRLQSSKN